MTVTLTSFWVYEDCDDEGFPTTLVDDDTNGEFQYRFWVSWPDGTNPTLAHSEGYTDHVRRGETGTEWTQGESSRRVLNGPGPHTIRVYFWGTEWDKDLFGWYKDEWLADQTKEAQYTVRTGDVSGGNKNGSFSLGNDACGYAQCQFQANFTVRSVEGFRP